MSQTFINGNGNRKQPRAAKKQKRKQPQPTIQPFIIVIPRESVERQDTSLYLKTLETLLESSATVRNYRDNLYITITGYDEDPRAWHEIEEVRRFIAALDREFPYFFWFINRTEPSFLLTLLLSIAESKESHAPGHTSSLEDLEAFMYQHYEALDELGALFRLKQAEIVERQEEIEDYFTPYQEASETIVRLPPDLRAKIRFIKWTVPLLGILITTLSWLAHACTGAIMTLFNTIGPIIFGAGFSFLLLSTNELLRQPRMTRRQNLTLIAGLLLGAALGLINQYLICSL